MKRKDTIRKAVAELRRWAWNIPPDIAAPLGPGSTMETADLLKQIAEDTDDSVAAPSEKVTAAAESLAESVLRGVLMAGQAGVGQVTARHLDDLKLHLEEIEDHGHDETDEFITAEQEYAAAYHRAPARERDRHATLGREGR